MYEAIQLIWKNMSLRERLNLLDRWVKSDHKMVWLSRPGGKRGPAVVNISFGRDQKSERQASIFDARRDEIPDWAVFYLEKQVLSIFKG
jgi:hypothetical protein